jgi:hypothetical protein
MNSVVIFTGVSIENNRLVEGVYFCAHNTDEHFILNGVYTVGSRRHQICSEAVLVDKRTVKIKTGENNG